MTPKELLQKLESLGSIESKALRKIRIQIEDPERTVKTSAVLSYLVRKEQLTEEQARQIMKGETPAPSRKNTDELMLGVNDDEQVTESAEVIKKPVRSNRDARTREDVGSVVPVGSPVGEVQVDANPAGVFDYGPDGVDEFNDPSAEEKKAKPSFSGKKDKRDQWNSRWPYIGFGVLGFLLMVGTFLWFSVSNMTPEAMYNNARDHFESSSYQAAIKAYDEYIEAFPRHKFIKEAKARRVQSLLRDSYDSELWKETLDRATIKLPEYADDEDVSLDFIRDDLGLMLPRSLAELTTKMLKNNELTAMKANLVEANGFRKNLVDNVSFVPSSSRKAPTNKKNIDLIENNIRTIEGSIKKEQDYSAALVSINDLGTQGKTEQAFKTFQDLTRKYGDLGARAELRELMVKTSELESKLISAADVNIETSGDPAPSVIQQTYIMGAVVGNPDEGLQGEVIPTLVDGSVIGFDAGSGEILWRKFVGLGSSIQPQKMGEEYVLVSDVGRSELLKLTISNGGLVWRVPIGETFFTPAMTTEKLVVTTASGKLLRFDPASGQLLGSAQLPQGANTRCFISEQDPLIYQAGLKSNLYVIGTEDMLCKEVFYLGHYDESISVPPYMYNGHLIVLVNGGDFCDMFVLRPKENGLQLGPDPVQVIRRVANGPVTRHLQRYGRWLLAVSDNGQMVILEFNQGDDKTPIAKFASERFDSKEGQPSFIETDGSSLWVCGTGAAFYKVKRNLGKFDLKVLKHGTDSFVAPCLKLDDKLFHVRKRVGSGMVSASLVDATTLEQIWRNDFGGEVAGPVISAGGTQFAVSSQGDLFDVSQSSSTGFVRQAAKASTVIENLNFTGTSNLGGNVWVSVGGAGSREFALIDVANGSLELKNYAAPSDNPARMPIVVDGQLIVANFNGQVAAIDPTTGGMSGEAFLPPVAPGKNIEWVRPVQVGEAMVAIATQVGDNSGATTSTLYFLEIEKGRSVRSAGSLESTGNFVGDLAAAGGAVFAADRVDETDSIVKVDATGVELARVPTNGQVVDGPWAVDGGILALLDSDQLVSFDESLNQKWVRNVSSERFACPPQVISGQLALVLQTGKVLFLDASGKDAKQIDLGQPIVHAPTFVDGKVFFSGMDGTVHVLLTGS